MASKIKTRYVEINPDNRGFVYKLVSGQKEHDFSDVKDIRKILSNQKARILFVLKTKKPLSIYGLAKELGRDFKSVHSDLKLLERFGFIEFHSEKKGKREMLKPVLIVNRMNLVINI